MTAAAPLVIWTCLAGRQKNLQVMMRYVNHLIKKGHVHECHLWNYARAPDDESWLKNLYGAHVCNNNKINKNQNKNPKVKLMPVKNKQNWLEYYQYYTTTRFPNHVILKCDDDIVYVDVDAFPAFIAHRVALPNHLLMFANIVNNGVCAFYQQSCGLLPVDAVGVLPFDTTYGKLWVDGHLAQRVHEYFIEHEPEWKARRPSLPVREYPLGHRFSINFFAILSKDLHVFQLIKHDDEAELSYLMPLVTKRPHCVDMSFFVSHLSFYKQREQPTAIDEGLLIKQYHQLAHKKGVSPFSA